MGELDPVAVAALVAELRREEGLAAYSHDQIVEMAQALSRAGVVVAEVTS